MIRLDLGAGPISPPGFTPLGRDCDPGEMPRVRGVYSILNGADGKHYVGSSHNVRARCVGHRRQLRLGTHVNYALQLAWNVSGESAFRWSLLESVDEESSIAATEARHIAALNSGHGSNGYNLILNPCTGTVAEVVRAKMSAARKGRPAWNKGIPCPEHVKRANSEFQKGRVKSPDEKEKLRAAMLGPSHPFRGKNFPAEHGRRISRRVRSDGPRSGIFKGVHFDPRTETFMARIYAEQRQEFLGRYLTEIEAAQAYNNAARVYFGEDCFLNQVPGGVPERRIIRGRPARGESHVG